MSDSEQVQPEGPFKATPRAELERQIMDANVPKMEREWWAAAEIERLRAALREAYEVYAGSDGFIPETAGEGYQQQIIKQMVDCICSALDYREMEDRT